MTRALYILLFSITMLSCVNEQVDDLNIIPKPNQVEYQTGSFVFDDEVGIYYSFSDPIFEKTIAVFQDLFFQKTELRLKMKDDKFLRLIKLSLNKDLEKEAYQMQVVKNEITIEGGDQAALFYGLMSLFQMTEKQEGNYSVQASIINDKPAFQWRGMHLDVSRHFYSVEEVKKILRAMALLKLNTFHWHLTDDQGWRIEIKKYPKLVEIGANRKETLNAHAANWPETYDGKEEAGFYTQEEIKDLIAFASAHQITIVPEIEMPGHAVAALAAYPQFACTDGPFEVWTKWGVNPEVFCAGKEETYHFLEDILDEVCELFPGDYIHIGGDECPKTRWEHCTECQQKLKEEGLTDIEDLQGYFTTRMEAYLFKKGKKTVGWDEILDGGVPPRAVIMSWRGEEGGITAAKAGNDVVMAPNAHVYFDHYQDVLYEPLAIAGLTRMQEVYDYNPIPQEMETGQEHILGAQAQLWTEYIIGNEHLEYMIFPRLIALSEALWTASENKDYINFQKRLSYWYSNLDLLDLNYRIDYPHGYQLLNKTLDSFFELSLDCENSKAEIYYTINGLEPNEESMLYSEPIQLQLPKDSILKSIAILPNGKKSRVHTGVFKKVELETALHPENIGQGLNYKYFKGEFASATDLRTADEERKGNIETIKVPEENDGKFFGANYRGYIKIPEDKLYTFYLSSDDGSVLYINQQEIIENDGFHYGYEKSGQIALKSGFHALELNYFQANYGANVQLQISAEGMKKQAIPADWFWYSK